MGKNKKYGLAIYKNGAIARWPNRRVIVTDNDKAPLTFDVQLERTLTKEEAASVQQIVTVERGRKLITVLNLSYTAMEALLQSYIALKKRPQKMTVWVVSFDMDSHNYVAVERDMLEVLDHNKKCSS